MKTLKSRTKQGSSLLPFLFNSVLDALARELKKGKNCPNRKRSKTISTFPDNTSLVHRKSEDPQINY